MYYLTYEKRGLVIPLPGNVNPATDINLFWRLPFPDEDNVGPGQYEEHNRGLYLGKRDEKGYLEHFTDPETVEDPGTIQLKHQESGLLVNVTCYHGEKLPEASPGFKPFWNGKGHSFELAFVKNTEKGVFPIVRCRHCGKMWRYTWGEILPWIQDPEMKKRLEKHAK
jgi:hypothetical protein